MIEKLKLENKNELKINNELEIKNELATQNELIENAEQQRMKLGYPKPTCTEDGWVPKLTKDRRHLEWKEAPRLGHQWLDEIITPATCIHHGVVSSVCQRCGMSMQTCIPRSDHHRFTEWRVVKKATDKVDGKEARACIDCRLIEQRTIPAKNRSNQIENMDK